jgi:hypothetical protein
MSEQIVEYLYFAKKELAEDIDKIFREAISSYLTDSQIQCVFQDKKLNIDFNIVPYNDSLHVTFKYGKTGKIGINEVSAFQTILREINIAVGKTRLKHTTLLDTNSLYLSKKLLPYLSRYEWSLRKLIYLVVPMHFSEDWIKASIPNEMLKAIKSKVKDEYEPDNVLQGMDLSNFEDYMFGENYIQVSTKNEKNVLRYKEIDQKTLLSYIYEEDFEISKPYSLWEEIFNKYVDIKLNEIQHDMTLIREGRNRVVHNKELTVFLYQELLKKIKKIYKTFRKRFL